MSGMSAGPSQSFQHFILLQSKGMWTFACSLSKIAHDCHGVSGLRVVFTWTHSNSSKRNGQTTSERVYLCIRQEGPRRRLRSSTDRSYVVPGTHNTFGDRSFAVEGPCVWNSLPRHLCDEDISYSSFRRELKTYWFSCNRGAM